MFFASVLFVAIALISSLIWIFSAYSLHGLIAKYKKPLNIYLHRSPYLSINLGTGGVGVFLMLSGYGLATSYQKKGIKSEYWEHKIKKVFVPYWIVTFLWAAFRGLLKPSHSELIVKNLLFIDYDRGIDGTMWYLSFFLLWYLLF